MTETDRPDLDARYGRTPGRRRAGRLLGWGTGVGIVAVFAAWLVWGGALTGASASFEATDLGFALDGDRAITVQWQFTVQPGTAASCAIEAQNEIHGVVGWKVVELPASQERTRRFTETVLTTEQAVTGLIYRCWLA